ncbi:pyridoxal phosphate-dependent aminotransferase [archaeon]|nr:MAG: pyridoxal phosphate-dependent aminotransferase [archaeon]
MHEVSERFFGLPSSEFSEILQIAEENKHVISLGPGEPDFATPKHIRNFGKRMLDKGFTHYSPPGGRKELREAITKKLKKENKIHAEPENVIVTAGSNEALNIAIEATTDPGQNVLVPNPGYLSYIPMVESLSANPISIPLLEDDGFELDPDAIKKLANNKTRVLIINSPSNPTGRILKRKTLEEIADIAIEKNLVIFSDEAYEKFVYSGKHVSIGSLNGMHSRVVSFFSFSKTYAMPGFRVGYAAGPKEIIQAMTKLHIYNTICAPTLSQVMAEFALKSTQKPVEKMVKEYDRRRKLVIKRLHGMNLSFQEPEGAFYAFPNITNTGMNSVKFSHFLLKNAKVLVVPGNEFGKYGEGYMRLSYATAYEKIAKAMDKMEDSINALGLL